jgi:primosomal protein N' (replication factor Y)
LDQHQLHPVDTTQTYATVILPIAVPKPYTYYIPEEFVPHVKMGIRVEVQFGKNKLYTALVIEVHSNKPDAYRPKSIISLIDEDPIIQPIQLKFWKWMASYYCCTLGEVMNAALPANLKLTSETIITISPLFDDDFSDMNDKEYLIAEALSIQSELPIEEVRKILDQKTVYPVIKSLLDKKIIYIKEDLKEKFKPKKVHCLRLQEPYRSNPPLLEEAFELLSRSTRQVEAMMAYLQLEKQSDYVRRQDVCKKANVDGSVIKAMQKKGVLEVYEREISRLGSYEEDTIEAHELSEQQKRAIKEIDESFEENQVVLLHGVTGSGKTRVYMEYIKKALKKGEQVLYLLPEIALTAQLITRLQKIFGNEIAVYHSRLNNNERVELWNEVLEGKPLIMGARSALFLPFQKLKLVIIDEEHDPSYKQRDPNPRYNGRDAAIYLAHLHGAKTIIGTATPSIESYFNTKKGKYGLVSMPDRYGGIQMPEIILADLKNDFKERGKQGQFSSTLLDAMEETLKNNEQIILFQNRRGYAPVYRCTTCGWHGECRHCDVSLTYHKGFNALKCHYCGYQAKLPTECPACGSKDLKLQGLGTEKIEDEIKIYFPEAKVGRMDFDTVRSKNAHAKIIHDFEEGRIDILVGTQMVTKGLDFENVALVGVISADQILQFPDFRSAERGFQLMTQVSGRSGRKRKRGRVIIQAIKNDDPTIREVRDHDYFSLFQREINERQTFQYPPFYRLIRITLKHKKTDTLNQAGYIYGKHLEKHLGAWVKGPAVPYISRIRSYYLLDFLVKLERDPKKIAFAKRTILDAQAHLHHTEGYSGVRVSVDVDPY